MKKNVKNKTYEGVILPADDPTHKGRYLVYIPELQFIDESPNKPVKGSYNGIWCYNRLGNFCRYTDTELRIFSSANSYGTWMPLKPGTHVRVKFDENDYNTGRIISIVSYDVPPNNDRDNFYLLTTTPESSWLFIDEKNSTFGLSLHRGRSNVWGTDDKIQISKSTGMVVEVADDHATIYHPGGPYFHIDGNQIILKIGGSYIRLDSNNINIYAPGNINIDSGGMVNVQDNIAQGANPGDKVDIARPSLTDIENKNNTDESLHDLIE